MSKTNTQELQDRMSTYATEFAQLARLGVDKQTLLNGDGNRHGLNHINELFQMLPDSGQSKEFGIRV